MSRYARRVDVVQPEIVADLRKIGFFVLHLHALGGGTSDVLVMRGGLGLIVEFKTPGGRTKPATAERQRKFREEWQGCPVVQCESTEDVINAWRRIYAPFPGGVLR